MEQKIRDLIANGEKIDVEFKSAQGGLPKNLYETVSAFSNTVGGYIILGVNDKKEIIGINPSDVNKLKKEFTINCNNEQIVNPTIFAELKEIKIDDKIILYAYQKS